MGSIPPGSSTSALKSPSCTCPRYTLKEARTRQDLSQVLDIIWTANYDPYDPFIQLLFPILGFDAAARTAAIAESKERFWHQHTATPTSHWWFVVDEASGRAVGCAEWEVHRVNPFPGEGKERVVVDWWPEGEYRDFCETIIEQVYRPRTEWMKRPHLALNWMSVIPSYRRRGVGSLLMSAGLLQADALDLECWMEATTLGKPLYEKHGFRSLRKIGFDTEREDATDLWRKARHELTPPPIHAMWRPKRGEWREEGKMKMPWDLGVE